MIDDILRIYGLYPILPFLLTTNVNHHLPLRHLSCPMDSLSFQNSLCSHAYKSRLFYCLHVLKVPVYILNLFHFPISVLQNYVLVCELIPLFKCQPFRKHVLIFFRLSLLTDTSRPLLLQKAILQAYIFASIPSKSLMLS